MSVLMANIVTVYTVYAIWLTDVKKQQSWHPLNVALIFIGLLILSLLEHHIDQPQYEADAASSAYGSSSVDR